MNIGIDARCLGPSQGGIGIYLSEILKHWPVKADADRISLFSHQSILLPESSIIIHEVSSARLGLPWYIFKAGHVINRRNLDVFWGAQNLLPGSLSRDTSSAVTVHDCVHRLPVRYAPSALHAWIHRWCLPDTLRRSSKILTVSRFVAEELMTHFGVSAKKLEVIHLGVRKEFWKAEGQDKEIARVSKQYGITAPFILAVGTIEPRKNLTTLLTAFMSLPRELQAKYQLVLAGKMGWKQREFRYFLKKYPRLSQLVLTGYVPYEDLPFLYAGADMLVFPSLYEGFGLPLIEAMATGCPVIASRAGSIPEVLEEAGLFVSSVTSPSAWSDAIVQVAASASLRESLRQAGKRRANDFSWEKSSKMTADVLSHLGTR